MPPPALIVKALPRNLHLHPASKNVIKPSNNPVYRKIVFAIFPPPCRKDRWSPVGLLTSRRARWLHRKKRILLSVLLARWTASFDYFQVGRRRRWWWRCLLSLHRLNWFISERVQESRYRGRWLASVDRPDRMISSQEKERERESLSLFLPPRSAEPFLRSYPRKARQLRIIITVFRLPISGYRSSQRSKKRETRNERRLERDERFEKVRVVAVTKSD